MALMFHADGTVTEAVKARHWLDPKPAQPDPLREWWCWLDRDSDWPEDTDSQ